jgi:tRNA-dihydrouridine synthase
LGVQEYEGVPDLTAFQQLQNAFHYHFVYSGDIVDLLSYHHIQSYFNVVDCCLLGRGILRNIFLAEELQSGKTLPREVRFRRFQHFYEDYTNTLLSARGPHAALANLKELWHYFATFFHLSPENLIELLRCTDYTAFDALAHDIVLRAQNV